MFCFVDDDEELDMLASLVEQEMNDRPSVVKDVSVDAQPCVTRASSSSIDNCEPVNDTVAPVTETDEQCQYFLFVLSLTQTLASLHSITTTCFGCYDYTADL